ncbi:hypothetical protein HanPI659440_Chr13g0516961 [Helianthus annuus]|nr:hypothetical protein HanPI659440_Chr13g0516961 [Helianthus annuus]
MYVCVNLLSLNIACISFYNEEVHMKSSLLLKKHEKSFGWWKPKALKCITPHFQSYLRIKLL